MLTILASEIMERFYAFLWPMLRISALLATAPLFSMASYNLQLRILMALVLTWLVYPLHRWPVIDPSSALGLLEVFNQLAIGVMMGLVLQIAVAAIVMGGQSIANAMGLSMASMIDPNMGQVPVISQFLLILSSLIFVGFGGHAILLGLILDSFNSLPIGEHILNPTSMGKVIRWSSMIFLGGLLLALPVMVTLLLINIGLGVVTRAAPSLNIFSLGFPAMIIAGFLVLILSIDSIGGRIVWLWTQGFEVIRDLTGVAYGR
jgi:flagellar biosynthetic protein FliR